MDNCSITRPRKIDSEELHILFQTTIADAFKRDGIDDPDGILDEVKKQMEFLNQDYESKGSKLFFLIARTEEKIIGTIAYSKPSELIRSNLKVDCQNIPEITSVYILPEYQGKGVGTLLFNAIMVCLLNKKTELFCLDGGYKKSQSFWIKKLGDPTVTLKDYWGKGLDHLIWLRRSNDVKISYQTK